MTRKICTKFFLGFKKKHLFITTCIEKQVVLSLDRLTKKCLNNIDLIYRTISKSFTFDF